MANEKQDHMALIAIVGIVAIVGLFLMFFSQTGTENTTTKTSETLTGQAYAKIENPKPIEGGDIYYQDDDVAGFWYNNEKQSPKEFTKSLTVKEKQDIIENGICFVTETKGNYYCYEDSCNEVRNCPTRITQIKLPIPNPLTTLGECFGIAITNPEGLWECIRLM